MGPSSKTRSGAVPATRSAAVTATRPAAVLATRSRADSASRSGAETASRSSSRLVRGGSMVGRSVPAQELLDHPVPGPVAAVDSARMVAALDEVSNFGSEGCGRDFSSGVSDSVFEEEGMLEEQMGLDSSLANATVGSLADQLFEEMPHLGPSDTGRSMGSAAAVGTSVRPRDGAAMVLDGAKHKGKARLVEEGTELPRSRPATPQVSLGGVGPASAHLGAEGAAHKASWMNLFKDNRNPSKGIALEDREVEGDVVMLEEEDVDEVEEAWGHCLVGIFAGRFPGMEAVRKLSEGWKVNCSQWRHRSGWIIFKFQSDEDRLSVLNGGPYFAYGSNLLLKILPSCFRFEGEDVSSVPIWIQLPGLPLDCWNARALSKIVSKVGKPITTDKMTRTKERISFARVLVEVDVTSDLVSTVEIGLPTGVVYQQSVIPEFTPKFCVKCKSFGHVVATCGKGLEERQQRAYVAKKKGMDRVGDVAGLDGVGGVRAVDGPAEGAANSGGSTLRPAVSSGGGLPLGNRLGQVGAGLLPAEVGASPGHVGKHCGRTAPVPQRVQSAVAPTIGPSEGAGPSLEGMSGQVGDALLSAVADHGTHPSAVGLDCAVQGPAKAGNKGKKKKKSGQRDAAVVQNQSDGEGFQSEPSPYDGLEASFDGWNKGGKKGKRR